MSPRSAPKAAMDQRRKKAPSATGLAPSRPRNARPPPNLDGPTPSQNGKGDAMPLPAVGDNLRRLRTERSLSLDALAQLSGVSRAMLGQIELNRSVPTITVLWRIARAFDLPFSVLLREPEEPGPAVLRRNNARFLTSADGSFKSRTLFPADRPGSVEFYEVRLTAGAVEQASPHPVGTVENVVVAKGSLEVTAAGNTTNLATGDAMLFRADVPHRYHNPGATEAIVYMVITYAQRA